MIARMATWLNTAVAYDLAASVEDDIFADFEPGLRRGSPRSRRITNVIRIGSFSKTPVGLGALRRSSPHVPTRGDR